MLSEVRESIAEKKAELENLPLETGRIDLISYASCPPCQYTLVFPSQRIKNSWEDDFLQAKTKADKEAPPTVNVAPPTSPPPMSTSQALDFIHPILLQSGRVGTKVYTSINLMNISRSECPDLGQISLPCMWASHDNNRH
jgi:hypothetical protein